MSVKAGIYKQAQKTISETGRHMELSGHTESVDIFNGTFRDKTVLVTGHTGFKGSWLCIWLKELGARVVGYSLKPYTEKDNFHVSHIESKIIHIIGDVRDFDKMKEVFETYKPEFVFHLAAQPIVRKSYTNPKETYNINIGGTVNLMECCRLTNSVRVIINVTSDKCYANRGCLWNYRETDPIGGDDPYSSSKGCAELITTAYRKSFFDPDNLERHNKSLASVRAGNVIGGGDWQKDRIVPDCIRALEKGKPIEIRNPEATRPWQHVLEPLSGYLLLASKMYEHPTRFCSAWNFGPRHASAITVGKIVDMIIAIWGSGHQRRYEYAKDMMHEAKYLGLDATKANSCLGWFPVWDIDKAVKKTVEWYSSYKKKDPYTICLDQIREYTKPSGKHLKIDFTTPTTVDYRYTNISQAI